MGIHRGWARLSETRPELAEQLSETERALTAADREAHVTLTVSTAGDPASETTFSPGAETFQRIRRLAAERDRVLTGLRSLPGFEELLLTPELPALRRRLAGHTAVVVSAAGAALVVPPDPARPVEVVPLPGLTETAARGQVRRLRAALANVTTDCSFDQREQAQLDVHAVLEWLWDTTAGPVLRLVEADRLWWCPIGVMTALPLHAAGRHRDNTGQAVLDRVVSSYTPSLTALADILTTPRRRSGRPGALAVGITQVAPELPDASAEAKTVTELVPGSTLLIDAEAELQAVIAGLHRHDIAHFACHYGPASGSADHPDLSVGLRLGKSMIVPSFLRDLRTTTAQLAFLSACSTASPDPTLLDEPLNIASAFHLSGFRGVIGTLWSTEDSADTAKAFYSTLINGGTGPPDPADAAIALNLTIRGLRDEYLASPTRWASHLHVGD